MFHLQFSLHKTNVSALFAITTTTLAAAATVTAMTITKIPFLFDSAIPKLEIAVWSVCCCFQTSLCLPIMPWGVWAHLHISGLWERYETTYTICLLHVRYMVYKLHANNFLGIFPFPLSFLRQISSLFTLHHYRHRMMWWWQKKCTDFVSLQFLHGRPAVRPTQPTIQWAPGALSLGIRRPGREAHHSPPSSAEAKNAWTYTSTPPIRLHGVVLS
jgi:hypothetical protein